MSRSKLPYTLIKRKPQNIYYVRYSDQKKRTPHSTGKKTKKEAIEYVLTQLRIRGEAETNVLVTLEDFTKDLFVPDKCHWLNAKELKGKKRSIDVIQQHRGRLTNHILPKFGKRVLSTITTREVDTWLVTVDRSNITKNYILDTMSIIWSEARKSRVVRENIISDIEKYRKDPVARDVFTKEELSKLFPNDPEKLINIWSTEKNAALFFVLVTTGMRVGEVLALKWEDIMESGDRFFLKVYKAQHKATMTLKEVKNKKPRLCYLLKATIEILNLWREKSSSDMDSDFIFSNSNGGMMQQAIVRRVFLRTMKNEGIDTTNRKIVPHSFRHSFNTYMRQILPDTALRKLTGHSHKDMTDHYDHPVLEDEAKALLTYLNDMDKGWNKILT